jgi:NAD(P)-dependent dehydrogenase (short-subunit alcohol dehydrogenase family)
MTEIQSPQQDITGMVAGRVALVTGGTRGIGAAAWPARAHRSWLVTGGGTTWPSTADWICEEMSRLLRCTG